MAMYFHYTQASDKTEAEPFKIKFILPFV